MSLSSGTRLGPYEIVAAIGAGGMGEVYRGHDATLNRDVAIKVLPAAMAKDTERLAQSSQHRSRLRARGGERPGRAGHGTRGGCCDGFLLVVGSESRNQACGRLQAEAEWQVLGVNDLAEEIHVTPALSVRTRSAIYSLSAPRWAGRSAGPLDTSQKRRP